jgi:hypothetical protein
MHELDNNFFSFSLTPHAAAQEQPQGLAVVLHAGGVRAIPQVRGVAYFCVTKVCLASVTELESTKLA